MSVMELQVFNQEWCSKFQDNTKPKVSEPEFLDSILVSKEACKDLRFDRGMQLINAAFILCKYFRRQH